MLTGSRLGVELGGRAVLAGVDVAVRPGEITVVTGPSGGGKSTLIRAMSLLTPPDSGTVTIDEVTYRYPDPAGGNPPPPWPRLTVVFQQLHLWPHLTIRQNITLPLRNHPPRDPAAVEALVEAFQLGPFVDRYPNQASVGQRQRAAIVRALALGPRYLLLDEVTSALDVEHAVVVLRQLRALRAAGVGIVLVTHHLGFARTAADRVLFLDEGRVSEEGGPDILFRPRTARLERFLSIVEAAG